VTTAPLSPTEFSSAVTAITSAFGDPTRREIYLFAHGASNGVTATEVAERFDLHPNVARHHLDKLVAGGYIDTSRASVAGAGGGAGRPSKRYRVIAPDVVLEIPVRTDEVIIRLLGRALAELGRDRAEALAEEVGVAYGMEMAEAMGESSNAPKSVRSALHSVADALSAHGFAAPRRARRRLATAGGRALPIRRNRGAEPGDVRHRPRNGAGHVGLALWRDLGRSAVVAVDGRRGLHHIGRFVADRPRSAGLHDVDAFHR